MMDTSAILSKSELCPATLMKELPLTPGEASGYWRSSKAVRLPRREDVEETGDALKRYHDDISNYIDAKETLLV